MADESWRIARWSRDLGRGEVANSDSSLLLSFDAAVATVDDFSIGELVEVELVSAGATPRVRKVSPGQLPAPSHTLPSDVRSSLELANTRLLRASLRQVKVWRASEDELTLRVGHLEWPQMHYGDLVFYMPGYVHLPWYFDGCLGIEALPWPEWRRANATALSSWSVEPASIDARLVVSFETESAAPGYIVCDEIRVVLGHDA